MENCFALQQKGKCGVLQVKKCKQPEKCKFYKTRRQFEEGRRLGERSGKA